MLTMSEPSDLTGQTLDGRYRLDRLLGKGGMGHVYEGVHVILGRKIAVKTLHPRLAHEGRFRERFLREAKAASSIQHPNVVQIMDFGNVPDGSVYFVMEHLEGRDLGVLLREQGKLPWSRARELLLQAVRALAAAHAHNIIHRDIKPGNCFLTGTGPTEVVKLLDFGIAKVGTDEVEDDGERLTGTGEVFGTVAYMAPEQASGEPLDARSDVYSLGVMAYEMLTGQVPFKGANAIQVITKHIQDLPRPPRELDPSIPTAVEALILRAMAKDPSHRFASMVAVEAALETISPDGSVRSAIPWGAISMSAQPAVPSVSALAATASLVAPSFYTSTAETTKSSPLQTAASDGALAALTATPTTPRVATPLMDATSPAPAGPSVFGNIHESTHPPPGQVDHPTAPLLLLTQPTGANGLSQQSGAMMADTNVHQIEPLAPRRTSGRVALMLGTFALVSMASVVGTLAMLTPELEPDAQSSITIAPSSAAETAKDVAEPQQPAPGARPPKDVSATPPRPERNAEPPVVSGDAMPPLELTPALERVDSGSELAEDEREDPPNTPEPGATAKRPMHLTQTCADRRARAAKALEARAWRAVLSAASVAACWPTAEQDERRSMRVMAYLDLGEFDKCVAAGRGAQDKQTQSDVKRCKELLEK